MAVSTLSSWFSLTWVCLLMVMVSRVSGDPEVDALYALRQSLSDPDQALASWDPNLVDACTWFHITCDANNRVTRVDIADLNLSGQLVPDLGNLENLQYLEMFKNNIQGSIPPQLGNLKNLISLDLYNNQLSGSLPPELGKLQSLQFLRLNDNKLTGEVPTELSNLHLKVLDLTNNNFTGPVPSIPLGRILL